MKISTNALHSSRLDNRLQTNETKQTITALPDNAGLDFVNQT